MGLTLVIDQNPAPVAASFTLGRNISSLSTRVRVDWLDVLLFVPPVAFAARWYRPTRRKPSSSPSWERVTS